MTITAAELLERHAKGESLVCPRSSLVRPGLSNELEETLQRESRDGGASYLVPVRLDDYVIDGWSPAREDLAQTVRDRVIADFRRALNLQPP